MHNRSVMASVVVYESCFVNDGAAAVPGRNVIILFRATLIVSGTNDFCSLVDIAMANRYEGVGNSSAGNVIGPRTSALR